MKTSSRQPRRSIARRGKTRAKRTNPRKTAIHEAGHAALYIALNLGLKSVTIIRDSDSAGSAIHGGEWGQPGQGPGEKDDATAGLRKAAEEAFWLRHAIAWYAGAEAVRQLMPKYPAPAAGAGNDEYNAVQALNEITRDDESIDLLFKLAKRRCTVLVEHYRPEIKAIARALAVKKTLSGDVARATFFDSLNKRGAGLKSF
jgi:hypothetical protein